jgi:hypothetical protein
MIRALHIARTVIPEPSLRAKGERDPPGTDDRDYQSKIERKSISPIRRLFLHCSGRNHGRCTGPQAVGQGRLTRAMARETEPGRVVAVIPTDGSTPTTPRIDTAKGPWMVAPFPRSSEGGESHEQR